MPTTILLVDDHPVFRKGLRLLFEEEQDMSVVGEAGDGQEAIERVRELSPDVVVMDITMPNLNGIEATRHILTESPNTRVVALSIHAGKRFVEDMLSAGAAGYILKESVPEELVNGIRAVAGGEAYLSTEITGVVVSQYMNALSRIPASGKTTELPLKEGETLKLLMEGNSDEQIAKVLHVNPKTVASTRRRIMEKLGVETLSELAEIARNEGLVDQSVDTLGAGDAVTDQILSTKLYRPALPDDHVRRPQLLELMEEGLRLPFTLVSAPAGYGKSTLVSCVLETEDSPAAWVSLDENDNDLYQFLMYLLSAVRSMFPDAVSKTLILVKAGAHPPLSVLANSLINEMDLIKQDFVLVLDDLHLIREKSVNDLLTELLRHPPRFMHLVLVSRRDPFLPISSLRAKNQLKEIRIQDLRFTVKETDAYLNQTLDKKIGETIAAAWTEKTEGWVTGLRLAALSMRHSDGSGNILTDLNDGSQYVKEYLFNEILSQQPPTIHRFLLNTSVLDRFCAPLCDKLCGQDFDAGKGDIDSWELINFLRKENLFIINQDTENRWFRYHHLFQQLLQIQLKRRRSIEDIRVLHSKASRWFSDNNLLEDALGHAMAANDIPFAVALVERHRHRLMDNEQWRRMEHILGFFPDPVVEAHPELLVMKGWILYHFFRFPELASAIDRAESLIDAMPLKTETTRHLSGEINALRGNLLYFEADGKRALSCEQQALDAIPPEHAVARGQATLIYITSLQMIGDRAGAIETASGMSEGNTPVKPAYHSRKFLGASFIYWIEGDLSGLQQIADETLTLSRKWDLYESISSAHYFLSIVDYCRNDMISAESHLADTVENLYLAHAFLGLQKCLALALCFQNQGFSKKASETAEAATAFVLEGQNPYLTLVARAFEAELALQQGRLNDALSWAHRFTPEPFRSMPWFYVPQFTLVKVLLAVDTSETREQATDLLARLHDFVLSIHNKRCQMDVLALQALLHVAQGEESAALEKMTESLSLGEPGGFIRNFVDMGPQMADLLKRVIEKAVNADYAGEILKAFEDDKPVKVQDVPDSPSRPPQPLVEPLTNREIEILELLARRLQNKEIADKLFISPETVKSHLTNIYQKLNVRNRRHAVEKAKNLGIL